MSNSSPRQLAARRSVKPSPPRRQRVILYWFSVPSMREADLREIRAQMEALAAENGMEVVDLILDTGSPKKQRHDYPMLSRFERGEADVLIVGRSDLRRRSPEQDWLEARTRPRPMALYTVAELRRLGVLATTRAEAAKDVFVLEAAAPS